MQNKQKAIKQMCNSFDTIKDIVSNINPKLLNCNFEEFCNIIADHITVSSSNGQIKLKLITQDSPLFVLLDGHLDNIAIEIVEHKFNQMCKVLYSVVTFNEMQLATKLLYQDENFVFIHHKHLSLDILRKKGIVNNENRCYLECYYVLRKYFPQKDVNPIIYTNREECIFCKSKQIVACLQVIKNFVCDDCITTKCCLKFHNDEQSVFIKCHTCSHPIVSEPKIIDGKYIHAECSVGLSSEQNTNYKFSINSVESGLEKNPESVFVKDKEPSETEQIIPLCHLCAYNTCSDTLLIDTKKLDVCRSCYNRYNYYSYGRYNMSCAYYDDNKFKNPHAITNGYRIVNGQYVCTFHCKVGTITEGHINHLKYRESVKMSEEDILKCYLDSLKNIYISEKFSLAIFSKSEPILHYLKLMFKTINKDYNTEVFSYSKEYCAVHSDLIKLAKNHLTFELKK